MTVHVHAYASQGYLKEWGVPKTLEDLDHHRLIAYSDGPLTRVTDPNWLLRDPSNDGALRRPALKSNNVLAMLSAVESGAGIAALPDYLVEESTITVRVLPDLAGPSVETYFVYPEELRASKRIIVFRDFLFEQLKQTRF